MAEYLDAPLEAVTVYEDRATLTRTVRLDQLGRQSILLGPFTPLLREAGLAFPALDGCEVESAHVRRHLRSEGGADTEASATLREALLALDTRLRTQEDAERRASERVGRLLRLCDEAAAMLARQVGRGQEPGPWLDALLEAQRAHGEQAEHQASLSSALWQLRDERKALAARLDLALQGTSRWEAELALTVFVHRPSLLRLRYTVPCAAWRPMHEAQLTGDTLTWKLIAAVWNATGEPWSGAPILCSTARPAERAGLPSLHDETLLIQPRDAEVVVEIREEDVHVARESGAQRSVTLPGVDDGGRPRDFLAEGVHDVPSDGRASFLPLGGWSAPATMSWRVQPELSAAVLRLSQCHAGGTQPLLAGPVTLLSDGAIVGRADLPYVAPGEPFTLPWGRHDELLVTRKREQRVDQSMIMGHQRWKIDVSLRLTNRSDAPLDLSLIERLPVSELKELSVELRKCQPSVKPDRDGMLRWDLRLAPAESTTLNLSYEVEAPSHVVLPL